MEISSEVRSLLFNANDFTKVREVTPSGFSVCEVMENNKTKRKVVFKHAKFLIEGSHKKGEVNPAFYTELYNISKLMHPAINPIEGYCLPDEENAPIIISTFAENESLDNRNIANMNPTQKAIVALGIASALKYLHNNNIYGINLKPTNILLDKNYYPKLTDFGFTKYNNNPMNPCISIGSLLYLSPEHFHNKYTVSPKSDVYAFSMILYRLFGRCNQYDPDLNPLSEAMKFAEGYRPEIPPAISPLISKIIQQCWAEDPNERLSSSALFDTLVHECKDIVDGINEETVSEYLKTLLEYDNALALSNLSSDKGKFDAARILYLSHDAPNVRKSCKLDIKQCADAGNKEAAEFLKTMDPDIDSDTSDEESGHEEKAAGDESNQNQHKERKHHHSHHSKVSNTEIVEAAANGEFGKVKAFIAEHADVNTQDKEGETALTYAARRGDVEILEYLLTVDGINVNIMNFKGQTALHEAAKFGKFEVVKKLMHVEGIEKSLKDKMGYTPLDWATTEEMKTYMIKAGAESRRRKRKSK